MVIPTTEGRRDPVRGQPPIQRWLDVRALRHCVPQGKRSTRTEKAPVRPPAYLRRCARSGRQCQLPSPAYVIPTTEGRRDPARGLPPIQRWLDVGALRHCVPQGKRSTRTEKAPVRPPAYLRRCARSGRQCQHPSPAYVIPTTEGRRDPARGQPPIQRRPDVRSLLAALVRDDKPTPVACTLRRFAPQDRRSTRTGKTPVRSPAPFVASLLRIGDRLEREKHPFGRLPTPLRRLRLCPGTGSPAGSSLRRPSPL